jgi:hypothetical protein
MLKRWECAKRARVGKNHGQRIATCNQFSSIDCGSQVFGEADFSFFAENIGFLGFCGVGTFTAKTISTSYRCDNKRQLPPEWPGLPVFRPFFFGGEFRILNNKGAKAQRIPAEMLL